MMLIKGCSNEVNRSSALDISPKAAFPSGDTK